MSTRLFDVKIRVEIISKEGKALTFGDSGEEDLHISFDVKLRTKSKHNEATVKVYNLSANSRNFLRNDGAYMRLYAGFVGDVGKIYEGTIVVPTTSSPDNVNLVTEITSSDGYFKVNRSYFSKTYNAGASIASVINDVVSQIGLPAELHDIPDAVLLRARSFDNKSRRVLNEITKDYGLSWRIDYGVLKIGLSDTVDAIRPTAVVLNEATGLIGVPTVKFERFRGTTQRRVVASSLLQRRLRPGTLVEIKSDRFVVTVDKKFKKDNSEITPDGVYLIDETDLIGDNFGGPFDAKVTGYGNRQ